MLLGAWPLGGKSSSTATNKKGTLRIVFLIFGYILFLVLGAAIFSAIEAPKIEDLSRKLNNLRFKFQQRNACVDGM